MKNPVFIVGAPRSGTTMLGRIFREHPDVAFWNEPRPIWEIGNALGKPDDTLTGDDVTPAIARKIETHFSRFLEKSGRIRFVEKTPSNILRLRFIHHIFPDCRIIFVSRDGPASVASILKMRQRPPRPVRIWKRVRETPFAQFPALVVRAFQRRRFLLRPPGWEQFSESADSLEAVVWMWKQCDLIARNDLEKLPSDSVFHLRYEEFVRDHRRFLREIFDFCELSHATESLEKADSMIDPHRADAEVSQEILSAFDT